MKGAGTSHRVRPRSLEADFPHVLLFSLGDTALALLCGGAQAATGQAQVLESCHQASMADSSSFRKPMLETCANGRRGSDLDPQTQSGRDRATVDEPYPLTVERSQSSLLSPTSG